MKFNQFLTLVLSLISFSLGGVKLTMQITAVSGKRTPMDQQMFVEKDRLSMTMKSEAKNHAFIYRQDKDAVFIVDPDAKSYMEMTRADVKKAAEQLAMARARMQEAMKNLPPEQKAMVEKMMSQQMPPDSLKAIPMDYKKVGSGKVGNWAVTEYDGYRGGKLVAHASVADFATLGISKDDFAVMKSLGDFFQELKMGPSVDFYRETEKLNGFPVRMVTEGDDGKEKMRVEVTEVKNANAPASQFEVPAGFTQKKMEIPDMSSAGGHGQHGPH